MYSVLQVSFVRFLSFTFLEYGEMYSFLLCAPQHARFRGALFRSSVSLRSDVVCDEFDFKISSRAHRVTRSALHPYVSPLRHVTIHSILHTARTLAFARPGACRFQ